MKLKIQREAKELLLYFKQQGYNFTSFESDDWQQVQQRMILRHDVDFDCDVALEFARMEADIGVQATYYFLLNSDAYNLISRRNSEIVKQIQRLGHFVSLHFDPVGFSDVPGQCQRELSIFTNLFDYAPKVISIHRPHKSFIQEQDSSFTVMHTYMARFNESHQYYSDSGGSFKYGHPTESDAFKDKQNLHLLLHPIWWTDLSIDVMEKLDWLGQKKHQDMQRLMVENCIPYREYVAAKSAKAKPLSVNPQQLT